MKHKNQIATAENTLNLQYQGQLGNIKNRVNSIGQELKLRSIQKYKQQHRLTHTHTHLIKQNKPQDSILSFQKDEFSYKMPTEKLINLLLTICKYNIPNNYLTEDINHEIHCFGRQLQGLFERYLKAFSVFELDLASRQEFRKKIVIYVDETVKKQFVNAQTKLEHSFTLNGQEQDKQSENLKLIDERESSKRQGTNDKKFQKLESSFNEINKLLEKTNLQPRFTRTSNLNSNKKRVNTEESSVQQIASKSLEEKKKVNKNKLKVKDALESINRLLNQ